MTTKEELHAFAKQVARVLGWKYDLSESTSRHEPGLMEWAVIKPGLTSYGVAIRTAWRKETHFACIGRLPSRDKRGNHRYTYEGSPPDILVRKDRGPEITAREIKRRLLPVYDPLYTKARSAIDDCNSWIDQKEEILARLAPYGRTSKSHHDVDHVYLHAGGVAVITTTGVDLRIDVSAEDAEFILEYLAQQRAERGA